ncbi:MAG: hypothetical protein QOJ92_1191 [Frankiales bacterium]|nr:hypothetical protein [Frankiales bacterium]
MDQADGTGGDPRSTVPPPPEPASLSPAVIKSHDRGLARRSRLASAGLILVLLGLSGFAVWTSEASGRAAQRLQASSTLAEAYARAAVAVGSEETLETRYRLEPSPEVRAQHLAMSEALVAALGSARRHEAPRERILVDQVLLVNSRYRLAAAELFAAVDRGDEAAANEVERVRGEPTFTFVQETVLREAAFHHEVAQRDLRTLQRLERRARQATPLVFLVGLLLIGTLVSVTGGHRRALEAARTRAVRESLHDALTGLPNRALLADRFGAALRADVRAGTNTGLLLLDLDRFKEVNDTLGHHYGDGLLIEVGQRLGGALRAVDTVARLGGDEFAVLLPGLQHSADATGVAHKLRAALEAPFEIEGITLDVEASIGVVVSGEHGADTATLLQRADVAMYAAKKASQGVCVYDPAADEHSPGKLALLGDLRRALHVGELVLHYQPKINIVTGDIVGVEALVRWEHPRQGLLYPDAFVPLAEHTGLVGPLTNYVLDAALRQARAWSDAGRALAISVNLSARNLLDETLPDQVSVLLQRHGVAPELLDLEVTESAIMTEPVRAQKVLERLATLGIRISIDDFGAGYTSLGQLKTLPVTELKIDRSFVMAMTAHPNDALIVRSVIDLGHNLGLTIVAEGVEDESALTVLANFGCDVAQGYHLSRAITAEALDSWCDRRVVVPHPRAGEVEAGRDALTV